MIYSVVIEYSDYMNKERYKIIITLFIVGSIALYIRAGYIHDIVIDDRYKNISLNQDSYEYIHLARNLTYLKTYAQSDTYSRYLSIMRTPGYPLFYAFFEYLKLAPVGVLWVQAVIGACIPVLAAILTYLILNNCIASFITGFLCANSATGILISGDIMVDLLYASLFIAGLTMLYCGIAKSITWAICMAGFIFGFSTLIKPTTIIWPIYSILVYLSIAKANQVKVKSHILLLFIIPQIAVISGWSARNYYLEKVFTVSTIGAQTLRHYLAVEVKEVSSKKNTPSTIIGSVRSEQERLRNEVKRKLESGTSIKNLYENQVAESINILSSNYYETYLSYKNNIIQNLSGPDLWKFYSEKLTKQSLMQKLLPILISLNIHLLRIVYFAIFLFICALPFMLKFYKNDSLKRHIYSSLAMILTFLYFALISGLTFWTGPRILYPVECVLFTFLILILYHIAALFRMMLKSSTTHNKDQAPIRLVDVSNARCINFLLKKAKN